MSATPKFVLHQVDGLVALERRLKRLPFEKGRASFNNGGTVYHVEDQSRCVLRVIIPNRVPNELHDTLLDRVSELVREHADQETST